MNPKKRLILILCGLLMFSGKAVQGEKMEVLTFEPNLLKTIAATSQISPYYPPPTLSFTPIGRPQIKDSILSLEGTLINRSQQPEQIIVFPVGGVTPFYAEFSPRQEIIRKPFSPPRPPSPPPPMMLAVPAMTRMTFRYEIDLNRYEMNNRSEVRLSWSFQFWRNDLRGEFEIKLPQRSGL